MRTSKDLYESGNGDTVDTVETNDNRKKKKHTIKKREKSLGKTALATVKDAALAGAAILSFYNMQTVSSTSLMMAGPEVMLHVASLQQMAAVGIVAFIGARQLHKTVSNMVKHKITKRQKKENQTESQKESGRLAAIAASSVALGLSYVAFGGMAPAVIVNAALIATNFVRKRIEKIASKQKKKKEAQPQQPSQANEVENEDENEDENEHSHRR